jgi:hypothetical protein
MPIADLIARLESATEGSRELDVAIADVADGWPVCRDPAWRIAPHGASVHALTAVRAYSTSLDAAVKLYKTRPTRIPSNPLRVCIDAMKKGAAR